MANLYAPNNDEPRFFQDFFVHLDDFQCDHLIIGGDFNLVLDLNKDKKGGRYKTHTNSVKTLEKFIDELNLIDVWRVLNPDILRYTWRQKNPEIHCRLDFFLVSQSLMCYVIGADITMGFKTDHPMIVINVALHSNERGSGYWKLNTSFLSEIDCVNQIRSVVKNVHDEYKHDNNMNPALLWEVIKLKIREQSLRYAANKKKCMTRTEEGLEKNINILQNRIETNSSENQEKMQAFRELEVKKAELEKIIEYKTKGAILRAKCRWHNEGEKNKIFPKS